MLIENGILSPGQPLVCGNPDATGILNADGSIKVFYRQEEEKLFDFLSGAARYIEGRSINGWIYWQVPANEGTVPLSDFRDQYISIKTGA